MNEFNQHQNVRTQGVLEAQLRKSRLSLVDTGKRNRLINFPKGSTKAKSIELIDELADQVLDILLRQGKKMSFLPGRTSDADIQNGDGEEGLYLPPPDDAEINGVATRHTDTKLQTKLTPEGLQKRLLSLHRDAKSMVEEQGVDVLFLAIGFLEWYEAPTSEIALHAPLVLLPVELIRDDTRSSFKLQIREDDLSHNIALDERLRQDFGISIPPIPDGEEWQPTDYFKTVGQVIESQKRFRIDENMMALGFFSFTKIAMFRDLDPANWPDGKLLQHPIIRALMADGFPEEEKLFPDDASMDQVLHPADMIHVVDADSSQALVVEAIRRGRNMVVQGPPGTGKSQTITNIIATAVREGKRVLFVAEKLAALNVVYSRLQRAGLSAICLELHSRNANKRAVLAEINRTLNAAVPTLTDAEVVEGLRKARDQLNHYAALFNTPVGQTGVTPFDALGMQFYLSQRGILPPEIKLPSAATWTPEQFAAVQSASKQLANIIRTAGLPRDHLWRGVGKLTLQPTDLQRLASRLKTASNDCFQIQKLFADIALRIGWKSGPTFDGIDAMRTGLKVLAKRPAHVPGVVDVLLSCQDKQRLAADIEMAEAFDRAALALNEWFTTEAWEVDLKGVREALNAKGRSFLGRLSPAYRNANNTFRSICKPPVPEDVDECIQRLDHLIAAIELFRRVTAEDQFLSANLGSLWRAENTDLDLIKNVLAWLDEVQSKANWIPRDVLIDIGHDIAVDHLAATNIETQLRNNEKLIQEVITEVNANLRVCFGDDHLGKALLWVIGQKFHDWANGIDQYDDWVRLFSAGKTLRDLGIDGVAGDLETGQVPIDRIESDIAFCRAEAIWKIALDAQPQLITLEGEARQALVEEFRLLENQRQKFAQLEVLSRHAAAVPRGNVGQMGTVRGEIARRRGHLPVRKLFSRACQVLQQIKPVMLMSPLSVAQFLPPNSAEFDLLVIDEASQVKPEDALGAIARCRQIAVIGDKKQLPPTSFFDRMVNEDSGNEDEEEVAAITSLGDMESVLTLCEARGVPGRMLRWHYRSRHPSLIEVSNSEFYEDGLFLPPAPIYDRGQDGFVVRQVSGAYDRGGKRTNRAEADEVIKAVKLHARITPERTLGVVTFSISQRQLIEDLLELERRKDKELDQFASRLGAEQLFVKNLENVQGDERDVIFVSVGYGPRQVGLGLDSMSFGPVSSEGGERRLNVLFTRARFRCEVFVSFVSGEIDLSRTTQRGPEVLKRFLKFGETGSADLPIAKGGFDSPFEQSVSEAIQHMGYQVDSQVGQVGFRIDLAVKHPSRPGSYICAVECDGANYHSSKSARERDRLRQNILEGQGWQFYRIWSTDWFRRPDREKEKLRGVLREIVAKTSADKTNETAAPIRPTSVDLGPLIVLEDKQSDSASDLAPPYEEANFSVDYSCDPHEIPPGEMAGIVAKIIAFEGPIHEDEVARRVARLLGKDRTGARISGAVGKGLRIGRQQGQVANDGKFWSHAEMIGPVRVRSRSNASSTVRRADMLPPSEIKEAIRMAIQHNGVLSLDEIIVAVSRLLGFDRSGPDLTAAISQVAEDGMSAAPLSQP